MARKRLKSYWKSLKNFLTPLESSGYSPQLEQYMSQRIHYEYVIDEHILTDDEVARINRERIEVARLAQDKDAINKNLKAQHRLVIATLITACAATLSAIIAIIISLHSKSPIVMVKLK